MSTLISFQFAFPFVPIHHFKVTSLVSITFNITKPSVLANCGPLPCVKSIGKVLITKIPFHSGVISPLAFLNESFFFYSICGEDLWEMLELRLKRAVSWKYECSSSGEAPVWIVMPVESRTVGHWLRQRVFSASPPVRLSIWVLIVRTLLAVFFQITFGEKKVH